LLLEHGFLVYVVELPGGYDPDSFVREHGGPALETRLREAPSYIASMKLLVDRRAGDLAVKERVVRHLLDDLSRLGDPLMQELYRKELGRTFGLSEAAVASALDGRRRPARPAARVAGPAAEAAEARPALLEAQRGLLRLALEGPAWIERLAAGLEAADFDPGPPRRLYEALTELAASPGSHGGWLDRLEAEDERSFATELALEDLPPVEPEHLFHDYLAALRGARLEAAERDVQRDLAEAEARGDEEAQLRLKERFMALALERSQLRKRATWT
jgi:DNA primase